MQSFRRSIALLLSFCLFATHTAFGHKHEQTIWSERRRVTQVASLPRPVSVSPLSSHFAAKSPTVLEFGSFRGIRHPTSGPSQNQVIIVQDIHGNEEAQRNIAQLIEHLSEKENVSYVALEGRSTPISITTYRNTPADERESVSNFLLEQNKISGTVYAALTMKRSPPLLVGIEDQTLYNQNVEAYLKAAAHLDKLQIEVSLKASNLLATSQQTLNPILAEFVRRSAQYQAQEIDLPRYLNALKKHVQLSPTLEKFAKAVRIEQMMDWDEVEGERKRFIDEKADTLEKFPVLVRYLDYVQLANEIDGSILFQDISTLENEAYQKLTKTASEEKIIKDIRFSRYLQKIASFSLTADEWDEYKNLEKSSPAPNTPALEQCEEFYSLAKQRDVAMAKNLIQKFGEQKNKTGIVVVGGFHAHAIETALNNAGFTTKLFSPRITKISNKDTGTDYLSVFAQEKTPLEKLVMGEKLFLPQDPALGLPLFDSLRHLVHRGRELLGAGMNKVTVQMSFGAVGVRAELARNKMDSEGTPQLVSVLSANNANPSPESSGLLFFIANMILLAAVPVALYHLAKELWPSEKPEWLPRRRFLDTEEPAPEKSPEADSNGIDESLSETGPEGREAKFRIKEGKAGVVVDPGSNQIERVYYFVPRTPFPGSKPRETRHVRFRYEDPKKPGRLNQWTQTVLEQSGPKEKELKIGKVSYQVKYDIKSQIDTMEERPENTLYGTFKELPENEDGYIFKLNIAPKPKPGSRRDVKVIAFIFVKKGDKENVWIERHTDINRTTVAGKPMYEPSSNSDPTFHKVPFDEDLSRLYRTIFDAASQNLHGDASTKDVVYFGDHDDQKRPAWAIATEEIHGEVAGEKKRVVRSIITKKYHTDGRCIETTYNLINGNGNSKGWDPSLRALTSEQVLEKFGISNLNWNQKKRYAPPPDPENFLARVLEKSVIRRFNRHGLVIAQRFETYKPQEIPASAVVKSHRHPEKVAPENKKPENEDKDELTDIHEHIRRSHGWSWFLAAVCFYAVYYGGELFSPQWTQDEFPRLVLSLLIAIVIGAFTHLTHFLLKWRGALLLVLGIAPHVVAQVPMYNATPISSPSAVDVPSANLGLKYIQPISSGRDEEIWLALPKMDTPLNLDGAVRSHQRSRRAA